MANYFRISLSSQLEIWRNTCLLQKAEVDLLSQREIIWNGEEHISRERKPCGPSLCWSRFQGWLHGHNFLATKSLLLKLEITKKVPKGSWAWKPHLESGSRNSFLPGRSRSQAGALWVASGKPPPPSLAGDKQPPVPKALICLPVSFSVLQRKYLAILHFVLTWVKAAANGPVLFQSRH